MNLISKNLPFFGVVIMVLALAWFFLGSNSSGGGDAAGKGMSAGFAAIYFFIAFIPYVFVTIAAFLNHHGNRSQPWFLIILIFVPVVVFSIYQAMQGIDRADRYSRSKNSHAQWLALATNQKYVSAKNGFRFEISSHLRGTFNTEYMPAVKFRDLSHGVYMEYDETHPQILGSVRRIDIDIVETKLKEVGGCDAVATTENPFKLITAVVVKVEDDNCRYLYGESERAKDPSLPERVFSNGPLYFIIDQATRRAFEVSFNISNLVSGAPKFNLEKNDSRQWFESLELGP